MSYQLTAALEWWDVTEVMTGAEIKEFCDEHCVQPRVQHSRIFVPVFCIEEKEVGE